MSGHLRCVKIIVALVFLVYSTFTPVSLHADAGSSGDDPINPSPNSPIIDFFDSKYSNSNAVDNKNAVEDGVGERTVIERKDRYFRGGSFWKLYTIETIMKYKNDVLIAEGMRKYDHGTGDLTYAKLSTYEDENVARMEERNYKYREPETITKINKETYEYHDNDKAKNKTTWTRYYSENYSNIKVSTHGYDPNYVSIGSYKYNENGKTVDYLAQSYDLDNTQFYYHRSEREYYEDGRTLFKYTDHYVDDNRGYTVNPLGIEERKTVRYYDRNGRTIPGTTESINNRYGSWPEISGWNVYLGNSGTGAEVGPEGIIFTRKLTPSARSADFRSLFTMSNKILSRSHLLGRTSYGWGSSGPQLNTLEINSVMMLSKDPARLTDIALDYLSNIDNKDFVKFLDGIEGTKKEVTVTAKEEVLDLNMIEEFLKKLKNESILKEVEGILDILKQGYEKKREMIQKMKELYLEFQNNFGLEFSKDIIANSLDLEVLCLLVIAIEDYIGLIKSGQIVKTPEEKEAILAGYAKLRAEAAKLVDKNKEELRKTKSALERLNKMFEGAGSRIHFTSNDKEVKVLISLKKEEKKVPAVLRPKKQKKQKRKSIKISPNPVV